jgi:hypothetical protein
MKSEKEKIITIFHTLKKQLTGLGLNILLSEMLETNGRVETSGGISFAAIIAASIFIQLSFKLFAVMGNSLEEEEED